MRVPTMAPVALAATVLSLAGLAAPARGGDMFITGCSLGCGGTPIECATVDVHENLPIRIEFSQPVAPASLDQLSFSFSVVDVETGLAAVGSTFVDPADPRVVVFRPMPTFTAGTLGFGFRAGRSYRVRVPGSDGGPGLFVRSTSGVNNATTLDCTVVASLGVEEADTFCFGDGSAGSACPCAPNDGTRFGCPTSVSTKGGRLALLDQRPNGLGGGDFLWLASELPSGCLTVLMRSTLPDPDGGTPFGDGLLCLATPVVRIQATVTSQGHTGGRQRHGAGPGTWHYQVWCRDDGFFCTPRPFNATNAATLSW